MPGVREGLLVSLSTAQFDAFELAPRICFINTQWSLSTAFFSCRLLRKSLGTHFLVKKVLPQTSQLYMQIGRIILSKSLSNTLKFPDANLLVLPSRVYIALLALLQSSSMFTLKFPLFVIIVLSYGYSLQISSGSSWGLSFFHNHDFCLFIVDHEFPLLAVMLADWSKQLCRPVFVSDIRIRSSA